MFLFARLIGIVVYTIILMIISMMISKSRNIKQTKKVLILYILLLFIMGYSYKPYITADLHYIENLIDTSLIKKDFSDILFYIQERRYAIYYLYYWIFGKLGNVNLLPAVTGALFYSNIFYILYKSCLKFDISPKSMSKTLLFFMAGGQFLEVISGIKSMFAFSIVALCCYREFFENKSFISNLILYVFAALMHDAALIAVGFRLIYLLFQKEKKLIIKIRNIIIFIVFALFSLKYGQEMIIGATSKGQGYIVGNVYTNYWEYAIAFLCDIFMIYSLFLIKHLFKADNQLYNSLIKSYKFILILLLFDNFFIFEYSIFQRYRTFIMMLIIPIVAILFEKCQRNENKILKKYYLRFQVIFTLCMIISLLRGNMSNLKFFEYF